MSTVQEIERAIEQLPARELTQLTAWLLQRDSASWNQQLDEDSAAGRLDFLFEEATTESEAGELRDWPKARQ